MAHITLNQYLQQVNHVIFNISMAANIICVDSNKCLFFLQVVEAIENRDGLFCAEMLSFKHPHVANPRLQVSTQLLHLTQCTLDGCRVLLCAFLCLSELEVNFEHEVVMVHHQMCDS